ncbi:MAG TPA: porin family protein, partial [Bacteroidales bacterium]|nr:porin family protein [Bacteroidales bacterium]
FGLKVSPAMSWIKPDIKTISYEGSRININGGLITDFNFTNNYAFSTGFEIISFGGKLGYPNSTADSVYYIPSEDTIPFLLLNRTYRLRYVNLPLTLKLKTNQIGSMVYYGQFGFDMGLRWRALADDEGYQKRITTTNKDVTVQEDVSFFRLSLNVGLGVEYNLAGNTSLLIGANYNNGFTNAFRKESKVLANKNGSRLKQNAFANYVALSVGVLF